MKKRIIKSGSIAFLITTLMGIINYILGTMFEKIIGIKFWGGDASNTYGFGVELVKFYPEYAVDNPIESHATIHIAPVNFVLTVVVLGMILYFIYFIVEKYKRK